MPRHHPRGSPDPRRRRRREPPPPPRRRRPPSRRPPRRPRASRRPGRWCRLGCRTSPLRLGGKLDHRLDGGRVRAREHLEGRLREQDPVGVQELVRREVPREADAHVRQVPERQLRRHVRSRQHHEHLAGELERVERPDRVLGPRLGEGERVDDGELAGQERIGQRRTQGTTLHLLVHAHLVAMRVRPVGHPAAGPLGRADRSLPGATGPLLPPRLDATAADVAAGLGGMGPCALRRRAGDDHLMHERNVHRRTEQLVGQLALADHSAGRVPDLDRGHDDPFLPLLTADRIITRPPVGPGIAPFSNSRLRSRSASTTSRFSTVTRAFPD